MALPKSLSSLLEFEVPMQIRSFRGFALASLVALAGCGGGSVASVSIGGTPCVGSTSGTLCLDNCSLGCHGTSCEITNIAQNEHVVLVFSQDLDPRWVTESTIQFRTASGDVPVGDFLINGRIVEFVPRVLTIGTQSFFGFRAGETYTMIMPGGSNEPNAVRSTSGQRLGVTISCTLNVTQGIIDLNGVPPSATLVLPTATVDAPLDTVIRLGFNEMVDAAPFQQGTGNNAPVAFQVARSIASTTGGPRTCATDFVDLAGQMRLDLLPDLPNGFGAIVTFTPSVPLPQSSCVRVVVTDRVHDLSGRPANTQAFFFQTPVGTPIPSTVTETFDDDLQLDTAVSGGRWSGGFGEFAAIGGDGHHGRFDPTVAGSLGMFQSIANVNGITVYTMNTESTTIPASNTLTGTAQTVNDGRYFFSEFVLPANTRLTFTGNVPPQISVRGRILIDGTIDISGESMPYNPSLITQVAAGQRGGVGGVFGGAGGAGGRSGSGNGREIIGGNPTFVENGRDGQDCSVLSGHAYAAQVAGTGGRGSVMFPAHGSTSQLNFPTPSTSAYNMEAAAGGGGGGLRQAGGIGQCITNPRADLGTGVPPRLDLMGPAAAGGVSFSLLPVPSGAVSSRHYLVGGAGGGGGGSEPTMLLGALIASNFAWAPGSGGGGGGGAIALRAGGLLRVSTAGRVLARGGSAGSSPTVSSATPVPTVGGGGSGGSIVLQTADQSQILGEISVLGGAAGVMRRVANVSPPGENGGPIEARGGAGAAGYLRLERVGGAAVSDLPNATPAATTADVGDLLESDTRVGFQSLFYPTGQTLPPEFVSYEIRAVVNGTPITFSDDPNIGSPARAGFAPIEVFFQAAAMNQVGEVDPADALSRPWRTVVGGASGLTLDARNAFRFLIVFDRSSGVTVQIDSVSVNLRT